MLNSIRVRRYFNPHSPCGERLNRWRLGKPMMKFQSTLPLRGATRIMRFVINSEIFQSTLPLRGATKLFGFLEGRLLISIHTPLAGSDSPSNAVSSASSDFNPHSPCGERRDNRRIKRHALALFQSTLPLRGATWRDGFRQRHPRNFNPHSPCGERPHLSDTCCQWSYFNPHSPCGERLTNLFTCAARTLFQSTLPLRGATATITL